MDPFRATAFTALWYGLPRSARSCWIALNDVAPATGPLIAANVAMLFALALMIAVARLTRHHARGHAPCRPASVPRPAACSWRARPARHRSPCEGRAVAIVLSGLAYASNGVSASTFAKAVRASTVAQAQPDKPWMSYRSARLLPTN
jgi:hypothetical protein